MELLRTLYTLEGQWTNQDQIKYKTQYKRQDKTKVKIRSKTKHKRNDHMKETTKYPDKTQAKG